MMPLPTAVAAASNGLTIEDGERAPLGSLFRVWPLLAVAGGGALGGLLRSLMSEVDSDWPWPTLTVNLTGAFVLGVVVVVGRRRWPPLLLAAVSVGVLGAFTTFSTVAGQLWDMADGKHWGDLFTYGTATTIGGWLAATFGLRLGREIR